MWLLPVVGFAVYGVYQLEPVAIGFAFAILLTMAIWFLSYSHKHIPSLRRCNLKPIQVHGNFGRRVSSKNYFNHSLMK